MKKFLTSALLLLLIIETVVAVKARPGISTVNQPGNYILQTRLLGDEFFSFRRTSDGYTLLKNAEGYFEYAVPDANNELKPSGIIARNPNDRTAQELIFLNTIQPGLTFGKLATSKAIAKRVVRKPTIKAVTNRLKAPASSLTPSRFLVVLVGFKDKPFTTTNPNVRFNDHFNAENYTIDGATGSVRKYFKDNSMNTFSPQFDVYGPVTLSKDMAYYGGNDAGGNDLRPDEMVFEACHILDSEVNFANYDANGDGLVDAVYVIYAGYSEAAGANENTVWPHAWEVSNTSKLDNKLIRTYSCSSELSGTMGNEVDGIGTACHEFSHVLGLPDLYDTDYDENGQSFDVDTWSVMASGTYNNDGKTPPYYTAVERELLGWGTAIELNTANEYSLNHIASNMFYKITSPVENEYFLLENRQLTGWDASLFASGMLVYRIDKTSAFASRWENNTVNAYANHNLVDILEADGNIVMLTNSNHTVWLNSLKGDVFPGSTNKTSMTDDTTPNLRSRSGLPSGKPLTAIAETNGVISFKFKGGTQVFGTLVAQEATHVSSNGFTANWNTATNATKYLLTVVKRSQPQSSSLSKVIVNFDNFPGTLPSNWSTTSNQTYTTNSNFGNASPSLKLDATGASIKSPVFSEVISSVSFWIKGQGTDLNSSILIEGSTNGTTWTSIQTVNKLPKTGTVLSFAIDKNLGYKSVRLTYTKSAGNLAMDDIEITTGNEVVVTNILTDFEVHQGTSHTLTNLEPGYYSYTVKAANATDISAASNEISVVVGAVSGIESTTSKVYLQVKSGTLIVNTSNPEHIRVFDSTGKLVVSLTTNATKTEIKLVPNRFYIVTSSHKPFKVLIPD